MKVFLRSNTFLVNYEVLCIGLYHGQMGQFNFFFYFNSSYFFFSSHTAVRTAIGKNRELKTLLL